MSRRFILVAVIVLTSVLSAILFYEPQGSSKANTEKGTVHVRVLLSPTCPVERNPPDPACTPKPYETKITIVDAQANGPYENYETDASGKLTFSIDPGVYVLRVQSTTPFPYCSDLRIEVLANKAQSVVINCDTGIR
ncbi:MAG: hypothetical protein Q8K86_09405 [Candidatus Nanopelagicaceae bacterium]|nr:hypothetical protein [Candidatus Nanopelagicaceae bacterium]